MANQFIKDQGTEVIKFDTPSFVNSGVSNQDIVRGAVASTSGNNFLDIAINKAINYSQKLDVMKANNEKAKHSIELQKNLQEYENMWQESGDNKYSDENYDRYLSGLNEIYDTAKMNFATTKYTKESDVLNWENSLDEDRNKSIFMQNGEKARFDIQSVTDETLMNVSAMANNYIMTGNYEDLKNSAQLLDGLSDFIPKHKLDEMKRNQIMTAERNKMENDMSNIINNPSLSIEQKRTQLKNIQNVISKNKDAYGYMAQQAVEMGLYSDVEVAKSDYQTMYQESLNKNGGIISRLDEQIRDEKYRLDVAKENYVLQMEKKKIDTIKDIEVSVKTKDGANVISTLENRRVTADELVGSEVLAKKYYKTDPNTLLKETDNYIPTLTLGEINALQGQRNIDNKNGVPRSEQVGGLLQELNSTDNLNIRENKARELITKGILTPIEVQMSETNGFGGYSSKDIIDFGHRGKSAKTLNKINNFNNLPKNNAIYKALDGLTYEQRGIVAELVVGANVSGVFGNSFGQNPITVGSINNSREAIEFVKNMADLVRNTRTAKYKPAQVDLSDINVQQQVSNNLNIKPLHLRQTTKEKGTEYSEIPFINSRETFSLDD